GEIIGEINVLQFGDYVDNPVIVLTLIDKDTLRIDADLLLDERDAMLGVMNSLTGRTYGKYSTKVLAAQLVREVKKQIKENN
ncbi:MAG: hypothetical protein GY823_12080, partial [Flavobacteriaceae bacterium]|nr:hypothetical protein [Flavobacteriaceae bacterium]